MIALRNDQKQQNQEVFTWLEAYSGTFEFLLSLKAQLLVKGYLSDIQIAAAKRCMQRDKEPRLKVVAPRPKFSVKEGQILEVGKSIARRIAEQNGSSRTFFNFEVLEVKAETPKAILIRTKASAKVTSQCCVCGRDLTDPASIHSGIGPVCAQKSGVPHGDAEITKAALEAIATKEVEVETWVPKSSIKNFHSLQDNG